MGSKLVPKTSQEHLCMGQGDQSTVAWQWKLFCRSNFPAQYYYLLIPERFY